MKCYLTILDNTSHSTIKSASLNGEGTIRDLAEGVYDFAFKSFSQTLNANLKNVNTSSNDNKSIRFYKISKASDLYSAQKYYVINDTYTSEQIQVEIKYNDLNVSNESNLKLYTCSISLNLTNLTNSTCSGQTVTTYAINETTNTISVSYTHLTLPTNREV